ncbi:DUF4011 domain-containing protein [Glutamicibacter uratoxydans]|uniref:DUF4011 domain-containing protein n=1 Tax=Glutamicibacter uratoxydans TaxID=43667 RepID=UPI003D6E82A6
MGSAVEIMSGALLSYISANLSGRVPDGDWPKILRSLDAKNGKSARPVEKEDLSAQIRLLTTHLGHLGYLFKLTAPQRAFLLELLDIRNGWAHGREFDSSDLKRAIDTCLRLLQSLELSDDVSKIEHLIIQIRENEVLGDARIHASDQVLALEPKNPLTGENRSSEHQPKSNAAEVSAESSLLSEKLTLDIACNAAINYATVQSRFPIIDRVEVDYRGDVPLSVVVTAAVTSGGAVVSTVAERRMDLVPGQTPLHDLNVELDPDIFSGIDSRRPGKVSVQVKVNDTVIAESTEQVEILPWTHWTGTTTQADAELLAAFVQPQHPEITSILSDVSDLLLKRTGDSKLEGFQSGSERVDAIAEAIFDVLGSRQIRYSNPPASWELAHLGGQHVRSAEEVLTNRFGTCLDTTVLFASVLEQVGINSTLWLVEGHAFLAYWRIEASLASASVDQENAGSLFNLLSTDKLRIVETTALTHEKKASIQSSSANTRRTFGQGAGAAQNLQYVIDLAQARNSGIFPLPARRVDASGEVTVVEYRPAESGVLDRFFKEKATRSIDSNREDRSSVPSRVVQWKNGLLDLSLRNRLLNFTDSSRFTLAIPDQAVASCEDLINDGKSIELLPDDSIGAVDVERYKNGALLPVDRRIELLLTKGQVYTELSANTYKTRLRKIASEAKTIVDQSGANNLYLAMGTLLWNLDGKDLRSPLILIPVNLQPAGRGGHFRVVRDESGTSTPNYCLAEKLREQFNITIPNFENPELDSSGIDLEKTFAAVTQAIIDADLPFHVEQTVDLAILQFAKFRMWKDLDENWATFLTAPLVKHLVETPTSEFIDPAAPNELDDAINLDDLAARLPVAADASQLEAVASAEQGRTFVLEGPPGTGKSQTITNLLAHAMSSGKRVLFVAEKRAALEVVRRRLNDVGLGAYALDLHDKGARPNEVRKQIKDSIDHVVYSDDQGMQLVKSDLRSARRKLALYASRIHDENAAGYSAYSANNSALVVATEIPALPITEKFASETSISVISRVRDAMSELPETAEIAHPQKNHPWGFIDSPIDADTQQKVLAATGELNSAILSLERDEQAETARSFMFSASNPKQLFLVAELIAAGTPLSVLDEINSAAWSQRVQTLIADTQDLATTMSWVTKTVDPAVLFMDLVPIREAAIQAESSGFLGLGKNKRRLQIISEKFGGHWHGNEEDAKNLVDVITGLIDARSKCAELMQGWGEIAGIELVQRWNPFIPVHVEQVVTRSAELQELAQKLTAAETSSRDEHVEPLREVLRNPGTAAQIVAQGLHDVAAAWERLILVLSSWNERKDEWAGESTFLQRFVQTRSGREHDGSSDRTLSRWIAFMTAIEILREHGLFAARELLRDGTYPAEDALRGFVKGSAEAALRERLGVNSLDDFSESSHLRNIERFTASSKDIRQHLVRTLPAQISERRAPLLQKESSRMGELQRQLNRRRGGQTVRQLMTNYGDLITTILPCVLVSPDSAARFFPPRAGQFDVVVYDEASQIRVADAIGTLGRANSAIVVGDSKQMPPTVFGGVGVDDESDENELSVVADEESILSECVQARVSRQWLSWHYRSQDESLIAFSNQQYYEGKLSSFPAPRSSQVMTNENGHGISLVRVDGKFHRTGKGTLLRTNPIEAQAIVTEIKRRFDSSPGQNPSLGVITFNVQQRNYIENLIRDLGDDRLVEALDTDSEGLFVKNLENVQGDERDVILFSTAFSVNDNGKLPLNFGPLNNAGGERRLNVAVTRARRQVVVFSSFAPEDLRAEDSSSVGIKHLRAYLDLAAQGTRILEDNTQRKMAEDRYRDLIAEEIRKLGFVVESNVGLSDFKIDLTIATRDRPEEPLVAVLLDNEVWAQRKTVGDRDGLPEEVLVNLMNWGSVLRIWLPAWLQNSESVLSRVREQMNKADQERLVMEERLNQSLSSAPVDLVVEDITEAAEMLDQVNVAEPAKVQMATPVLIDEIETARINGERFAQVFNTEESQNGVTPAITNEVGDDPRDSEAVPRTYQQWQPRTAGTPGELDEIESRPIRLKASDLLSEIASVEWPLTTKRLSKLANSAFGLGKVSTARETAMISCLDKSTFMIDDEQFVWPVGLDPLKWHEYRTDFSGKGLSITDISPREIANVMCQMANEIPNLDVDTLKRETMGFFGYKRFTVGIANWLQRGLEQAVREERLTIADGRVSQMLR